MAVGYLCLIWLWSLDNAQDGDLSTLTERDIASICDYRGKDPKHLVSALKEAGFLNPDLTIHDWFDYTGKLIIARKSKQKRDRQYYSKKKSEMEIPLANSLPIEENRKEENSIEEKIREEEIKEDKIIKNNIKEENYNGELERLCNFYTTFVHQPTNTEKLSLKKLLEDFYVTDIEDVIFKYSDRIHSVLYIEKVLKNGNYQDRKRSTFDINELDKIIKSL